MSDPQKNNPILCNESVWKNNENLIWLGSTLKLIRNLEKFHFPSKLTIDKRQQIASLLAKNLLSNPGLKQAKLFRAEELSSIEKEFLLEHFLSVQSYQEAQVGEAFVLDETGEFIAVLNLKDHLLLEVIDTREELENAWDRLMKIELELSKTVNFAFSPKFGYLASDPNECGTGLIVTIFLHIPALIHTLQLEDMIKDVKDEGIIQMGLQGSPDELIGDVIAFCNRFTLGVTDENIFASLRTLAAKVVAEEKRVRRHLKGGNEHEVAEMKNKVSRAYAVLLHSYQIEAVEAMQALSLVKLGLDLEWLKGCSQALLNHLLFACRRAHLLCHYGQQFSHEEMLHKRAEFIHKSLHGLELLI